MTSFEVTSQVMNLKTVLKHLEIADYEDIFKADWDVAQASRPAGEIPFLRSEYVEWACQAAFLPKEMTQAALAVSSRIAVDEVLSSFAWYCHERLFRAHGKRGDLRRWPVLSAALASDAGMFYVLILLSGTPQMREIHRARRVPLNVVRDTVLGLKLCMETEDHYQQFGHWGISPRILNWLMNHWRGELYRLGRLQFQFSTFHGQLRAFRHRRAGTVLALSEEGVRYRSDGQIDGAGGVHDTTGAFTSSLSITDTETFGYPISPRGYAVRRQVRLPAAEWKQVLAPGDPTLATHIPAGSPMTYELCGQSIGEALRFFPKHFPDKPFVAFTCHSWILDSQFEKLLPPASNLVRFQKEMYLYPLRSSGESTLKSVFGRVSRDVKELPRKTTMQRAFARHLQSGGHFRGGGFFLLAEDFHWGSQFYRS